MPLFSSEKDRRYAVLGMRIASDFGASIAVPVVILVIIGQKLDGKWGTGYAWTIGAFILAAVISGRMIYKKAKAYGKEFQAMDSEKK
jgi:thioredoxin-like negative regulator of GroEL